MRRKIKGFTLIELLIVVVIIGILATFVIIAMTGAIKRAKDAKAKDAVSKVADSVELYMQSSDSSDLSDLSAFGCTGVGGCTVNNSNTGFNKALKDNNLTTFKDSPVGADASAVRIKVSASDLTKFSVWGTSTNSGYVWCANGTKDVGLGYNLNQNQANAANGTPTGQCTPS